MEDIHKLLTNFKQETKNILEKFKNSLELLDPRIINIDQILNIEFQSNQKIKFVASCDKLSDVSVSISPFNISNNSLIIAALKTQMGNIVEVDLNKSSGSILVTKKKYINTTEYNAFLDKKGLECQNMIVSKQRVVSEAIGEIIDGSQRHFRKEEFKTILNEFSTEVKKIIKRFYI